MKQKAVQILKNPFFSGSLVMIVGSMGVNVLNYVFHLLMGRMLGPSEYGILASIYSILYIVSIVPQSASITIVKFISSAKNDSARDHIYSQIQSLVHKVALGGSVFLLIITPLLQHFLKINSFWTVVWIVPVYYFSIVMIANIATLQGVLAFFQVVVINFVSSFIKLLLGVVLVVVGFAATGAVFSVGVGVAVAFVISILYIRHFIEGKSHEQGDFKMSRFIKYSGPVIVQALAFTSLFTMDLVLVKHFFSDFDAGLYASLSTLGKIIFFAASPVSSVMFPLVARRSSQKQSGRNLFILSTGAIAVMSFSIALFYYFFPEFTIKLLYGSKYLVAAKNLVWMGVFISLYTVCQQIVTYFLSIDIVEVAILPLVAAVLQVVLIFMFHNSILEVLQISVFVTLGLMLSLLFASVYNRKKFI